ncbi:1,2-phenylacetyl-CoA epoxidase subunit B [Thermogemmatispora tikiterensis]|uniref:Phenylacetic acid degradation protein PaaB n=1 Tax=Thermogemmatispora tikiterensis TaxID=1825093 RepID=A0A328VFN4_9CHLR|nr:1,2-phenylacetyl-CoA epoxidase subunit B [Thermogemmatispora tikiterensis]RAQ94134.1 hypothetical protein A4R35_01225 [Thermogemmatispora tikiterensis]
MSNQVFEVFVILKRGDPATHVGSVVAPDPVLALHEAKETYVRRTACVSLWVVPRSAITAFAPEDEILFQAAFTRDYRQAGYFTRHERQPVGPAPEPDGQSGETLAVSRGGAVS